MPKGRKPDGPGRLKRAVSFRRECLDEVSVQDEFNSHLWKNFSHMLSEAGDIKSEWTIFKALIITAAVTRFGQKAVVCVAAVNPGPAGGHQWRGKLSS